mmetsp:Transcript_11461/g.32801  ORF Transcript_11461/g.32801 Transcript_11461/m.32801 type:complete len:310 (-) Transcript_11461:14-943(-)
MSGRGAPPYPTCPWSPPAATSRRRPPRPGRSRSPALWRACMTSTSPRRPILWPRLLPQNARRRRKCARRSSMCRSPRSCGPRSQPALRPQAQCRSRRLSAHPWRRPSHRNASPCASRIRASCRPSRWPLLRRRWARAYRPLSARHPRPRRPPPRWRRPRASPRAAQPRARRTSAIRPTSERRAWSRRAPLRRSSPARPRSRSAGRCCVASARSLMGHRRPRDLAATRRGVRRHIVPLRRVAPLRALPWTRTGCCFSEPDNGCANLPTNATPWSPVIRAAILIAPMCKHKRRLVFVAICAGVADQQTEYA